MITKKKVPYADTKIDPFDSQADISKLLKSYGIQDVQWTMELSKNDVSLKFALDVEIKGVHRKLGIEIKPPAMSAMRRTWNVKTGRYEKINAPNWAQSLRLMFYYLKSKLEGISFGLVEGEREFFAQVITSLPDGRQGTVFDLIGEKALQALPTPEPTIQKNNVTEAEFTEQS